MFTLLLELNNANVAPATRLAHIIMARIAVIITLLFAFFIIYSPFYTKGEMPSSKKSKYIVCFYDCIFDTLSVNEISPGRVSD